MKKKIIQIKTKEYDITAYVCMRDRNFIFAFLIGDSYYEDETHYAKNILSLLEMFPESLSAFCELADIDMEESHYIKIIEAFNANKTRFVFTNAYNTTDTPQIMYENEKLILVNMKRKHRVVLTQNEDENQIKVDLKFLVGDSEVPYEEFLQEVEKESLGLLLVENEIIGAILLTEYQYPYDCITTNMKIYT